MPLPFSFHYRPYISILRDYEIKNAYPSIFDFPLITYIFRIRRAWNLGRGRTQVGYDVNKRRQSGDCDIQSARARDVHHQRALRRRSRARSISLQISFFVCFFTSYLLVYVTLFPLRSPVSCLFIVFISKECLFYCN